MTKSLMNKAIDCACHQYLLLAFRRLSRFKEAFSPYFADNFRLFDLNRLGKQIEDKHCKDVVLRI